GASNRATDVRGGIPVCLGRLVAAICASDRDHRPDCGWPHRALSLRNRFRTSRSPPRHPRRTCAQPELAGGASAAVLLSLRSRNRRLQPCHHADRPGGRDRNGPVTGRPDSRSPQARASARRITPMWSGTPLFPESASTMAGRVDAVYFFLLAVAGVFGL